MIDYLINGLKSRLWIDPVNGQDEIFWKNNILLSYI